MNNHHAVVLALGVLGSAGPAQAALLDVRGRGDCPSPAAVAARLPALLASQDEASRLSGHHAQLESTGTRLTIRLEDEAGQLVAERTLTRKGSCSTLADAAAVVLATWHSQLTSELPALSSASPPPVRPDSPRAARFDLGLGPALVAGAGSPVAGASLELLVAPTGGSFGIHLGGLVSRNRRRALSDLDRTIAWRRLVASIGPAYIRTWARWQWMVGAGAELGWFRADGIDFPVNLGGGRFSPGFHAGTRLARLLNDNTALALSAGTSAAFNNHEFVAIGNERTDAHRPLDMFVAFSVCVGRFR
ncbi:MAG TPA: hypothetical protein VGG33_05360 [Polyangia bacterium]